MSEATAVTPKEHIRKANEALEKATAQANHPDQFTRIAQEYRELAETVGALMAVGLLERRSAEAMGVYD